MGLHIHTTWKKNLATACMVWAGISFFQAQAQQGNGKISFTGAARSWLDNDAISGTAVDRTKLVKESNSGHVLVDVGVNVKPNAFTMINATIRARNEFGGFYGSGASVRVRQIFLKGVIAQRFNYQLGDIDLKQSKYTLWNYDEEGRLNEATTFAIPRNVIYYDYFYTKNNTWRTQGAQLDFGFTFDKIIEKIKIDGNISRVNPQSLSLNEKYIGGGALDIKQSKWLSLGMNYMNMFEIGSFNAQNSSFTNRVLTANARVNLTHADWKTAVSGEVGNSSLAYKNYINAPGDRIGGFYEVKALAENENLGLKASVGYRSVDNNFISFGAQNRRLNYFNAALASLPLQYFPNINNSNIYRDANIWDLSRDVTMYKRNLDGGLTQYNPIYANALPYGQATPNRQGVDVEVAYEKEIFEAKIGASLLSDIVGQGTLQPKSYQLIKASATVFINKALQWEKNLKFNLGFQSDRANRSGAEFEKVNFQSNLLDAGLDIEAAKKFEILLGYKMLASKGNEFLPVRDAFTQVNDYAQITVDANQQLLGLGVRYNFSNNVFVSIQDHYLMLQNKAANNTLNMNQVHLLFNLAF